MFVLFQRLMLVFLVDTEKVFVEKQEELRQHSH